MNKLFPARLVTALLAGAVSLATNAEVRIGATLSTTGSAASLGIPVKNALSLLPAEIAGEKITWIILDDATDPTQASKNARRSVDEEKVDLLVGSNITPNSLAVMNVAAESSTPAIAIAGSGTIVAPMDAKRRWMFKVPQNESLMARAIFEHMAKSGVKSVGFIGFADSYGEGWWKDSQAEAAKVGIQLVASERYARTDTSVNAQTLKLLAAKPDAVLIAAAGTPAVLPHMTLKQRGYAGKIYQTHGVANPDFLRVGGKNVEGGLLPVGPVQVAEQLPDSHPSKKPAREYIAAYEAKFGTGSATGFGAYSWDLGIWLQQALPVALKAGKPGTPEFRSALRDALENLHNVIGAHGVYNLSPTDHQGLDNRGYVIVSIQNGSWKLAE